MQNSEMGFSSSKSTAIPNSSCVGENNENESCQDNGIPKSQNQKKVSVKHFMSPTISAASKARKKILVERNENLITSEVQNYAKKGSGDIVFNPSDNHCNESNCDGEKKSVVSGSLLNAYDPLSNYISPRPKFMRFNPNKRHEILSRLDREGCKLLERSALGSLNGSSDQEDSSEEEGKISKVSPFKENKVELNEMEIPKIDDDDGDDDDDDDEEGFEEEIEMERGGWCFRGVIKILFTAVACLLSVSYICSVNLPSTSLSQDVMRNLSNGYTSLIIKEQSFEPINSNAFVNGFLANQPEYDLGKVEYAADFEEDDVGEIEESFDLEMSEAEVSDVYGNYEEIASDESDYLVDKVEEDNERPDESLVLDDDDALYETETEDLKVMDHQETHEELNVRSKEDLAEFTDHCNEGPVQKTKSISMLTIVIVSLISSMIVSALALLHYSKKKKITRAKEYRSHTVSEPKVTNLVEKKVEFLARSMQRNNTPLQETHETIKDEIHAPNVELLGEIVFGQVIDLRICSETRNTDDLKEVDTDTSLMRQLSLAQSGSTPARSSSHVYESKSLRTKGWDAEEAVTEVTPLRRSARLRNRTTITSP